MCRLPVILVIVVVGCRGSHAGPPAALSGSAIADDAASSEQASRAARSDASASPERDIPATPPSEDSPPCGSGRTLVWKIPTGYPNLERASLGPRGAAFANELRFSPGGRWVLTVQTSVRVWDARCGGLRDTLPQVPQWTTAAISPDGSRIALSTGDAVILRSFADGRIGPELAVSRMDRSGSVEFSVDGARLVVVQRNGHIRAVDAQDGTLLGATELQLDEYDREELAMEPHGAFVAVATHNRVELRDGHTLVKLAERTMPALRLAFSPDGATLYVRTSTKGGHAVAALRVPDLAPGLSLEANEVGDWSHDAFSLSSDGSHAASIVADHLVLWTLPAAKPIDDVVDIEDDDAFQIVFSPRDPRVFAAPVEGTYQVRAAQGPQLYLWRILPAP